MRSTDPRSAVLFRTAAFSTAAVLSLMASACGGSDGPDLRLTVDGPLSVAEAVGSYTTECVPSGPTNPTFKIVEGTFANLDNGSGRAVVHYKTFGNDSYCKPASLAYDFTATFEVRPIGMTKGFPSKVNDIAITETASVADATLVDLVVSKGRFTTKLPVPGITAKVGYLLNKPNLRFVSGHRDVDGLGSHISPVVLKRIP